jgi:hypothetical protein
LLLADFFMIHGWLLLNWAMRILSNPAAQDK